MSSLDECINKRRSYRRYQNRIPEAELISLLLESSLQSPSPSNSQPVRFIRIEKEVSKQKLKDLMNKGRDILLKQADIKGNPGKIKNKINFYWRFSEFILPSPVLFAVGHTSDYSSFLNNIKNLDLLVANKSSETSLDIAIGLSLENIILKATELGLGSCILTAPLYFILQDFSEVFELANFKLKAFLTIGYPAEEPLAIERKKLEEIYQVI